MTIKLIDIININDLQNYKVHLATTNFENKNIINPLQCFIDNTFKEYQGHQTKRNFERKYIISFIGFKKQNTYLFAGIYKSMGNNEVLDKETNQNYYKYNTELTSLYQEYIGRLIISYKRTSRQSYPYLERIFNECFVSEILEEQYSIEKFVGHNNINLSFDKLKSIIIKEDDSWKTALTQSKGIYLIVDKMNGKQYVGSAGSDDKDIGGFWSRWSCYIKTGHGGNKQLVNLIKNNGIEYAANNFKFSILEYMTPNTNKDIIYERECFWKEVLLTRQFGYNDN